MIRGIENAESVVEVAKTMVDLASKFALTPGTVNKVVHRGEELAKEGD